MLPFMQKKPVSGVIVEKISESDDYQAQAMEAAAQDLISALAAKDAKATAKALQAAFEICDSMPHEEGPHTNEIED